MKHAGNLIKNRIESSGLIKKNVAKEVGISPTYLSELFAKKSMDCELFERICYVIGLDPIIIFDSSSAVFKSCSDISASTLLGSASVTIGETQALRDLLAEKERTIQILLAANGLKLAPV